jgi:dTDP-4-dehydrorhamnose 3,5-epimerase
VKFLPTSLPEVIVVEPVVHRDDRGYFLETYHAEKFRAGGLPIQFVQDNISRSSKGILRGLHAQLKKPQGKLVRAIEGEIFDVAVDIRPESPRYRQWVAVTLSGDNLKSLYIPAGFLHGFCVLSEVAVVEYKCTALYDPTDEIGVRWNDPEIGIKWPIPSPLLSPKDQALPALKEYKL